MSYVFFPGQLIKKVRGDHNVGITARFLRYDIVEEGTTINLPDGTVSSAKLTYDGLVEVAATLLKKGGRAMILTDQWEPVITDDMKPATWEGCVWKPENCKDELP